MIEFGRNDAVTDEHEIGGDLLLGVAEAAALDEFVPEYERQCLVSPVQRHPRRLRYQPRLQEIDRLQVAAIIAERLETDSLVLLDNVIRRLLVELGTGFPALHGVVGEHLHVAAYLAAGHRGDRPRAVVAFGRGRLRRTTGCDGQRQAEQDDWFVHAYSGSAGTDFR